MAPSELRLHAELIQELASDEVLQLQLRAPPIASRIRPLQIVYHLHADALGEANSVSIEEPANAVTSKKRLFLRRMRVPRAGAWALENGATFHQTAACADEGGPRAGRSLQHRLHWPAVDDDQFLQPEDLAPGAALRLLGHRIRVIARAPL